VYYLFGTQCRRMLSEARVGIASLKYVYPVDAFADLSLYEGRLIGAKIFPFLNLFSTKN